MSGAVPDDEHRTLRLCDCIHGIGQRRCWWGDASIGDPSVGATGRGLGRDRLHLIGQYEMRNTTSDDDVLARHRHQLGVVGPGLDGLAVAGDIGERPIEVEVLERPLTLDGTCPEIARAGARSTRAS